MIVVMMVVVVERKECTGKEREKRGKGGKFKINLDRR